MAFLSFLGIKTIKSPLEQRTRKEVCALFNNKFVWNPSPGLKCHVLPTNTESCTDLGTWSNEDKNKSHDRVNYFRELCGLSQIPYTTDAQIQKEEHLGALLMYKNNRLAHTPWNSSYKCYSEEAARGPAKSNCASGRRCVTDTIPSYMDETNNAAANLPLGHRRWIIHPSLAEACFGIFGTYSEMRTMGFSKTVSGYKKPDIWAYPAPGYFPILKGFSYPIPDRWNVGSASSAIGDDTTVTVTCDGKNVLKSQMLELEYSWVDDVYMKIDKTNIKHGTNCNVRAYSAKKDTEWIYNVKFTDCSMDEPDPTEDLNSDINNNIQNSQNTTTTGQNSSNKTAIIAGSVVGAIVVIAALLVAVIFIRRTKLSKDAATDVVTF